MVTWLICLLLTSLIPDHVVIQILEAPQKPSFGFLVPQHPSRMLSFTPIIGHLLVWTAPDGIKRARMRSL
jgi:hypothetical protein